MEKLILDVSAPALTKVGKYVASSAGNQLGYVIHKNKYVEEMRLQVQNLDNRRDEVQRAVDAERRNEQEIKSEVMRWLESVTKIMAEAQKLEDDIRSKKKWASRYKLNKDARNISRNIRSVLGDLSATPAPGTGSASLPLPPLSSAGVVSVSVPPLPLSIEFMSSANFMAFESTKRTMHQIVEALRDENFDVVGIVGMGGIGKTTIVKEIAKQVKQHKLFDEVVVAVVSQAPDVRRIQGEIADMLGLRFHEESELGRASRLYGRIKNAKSILMILDDVWTKLDLKAVGIPQRIEHEGCKLILTTRRENVLSTLGIQPKAIHVNVLSAEESWDLFKQNASDAIDSPPLKEVAMDIVRECQGLPIALVTVGRALRGKDLDGWNDAIKQLRQSRAPYIEGVDQLVFSCLRLSYNYLPHKEAKVCFLFCSLFPEDYDIEIEYFARFGMGKQLFEGTDTMLEARDRACMIIKYLRSSCLLLESKKEGCVKMHDVVRDVAISLSYEEEHLFLTRSGAGLKKWPTNETFGPYTDISLIANDIQVFPEGIKLPRLETLLMRDNQGFEAFPNAFFEGMTMLKVLDLSEQTGIRFLPSNKRICRSTSLSLRIFSLPESFKYLVSLRTLFLEKCKLGDVSGFGSLKKLQILSLSGSDIKALPKEIGEMTDLRLLDLTFCQDLKIVPANVISQLSQLEELYMGCSFRDWEIDGIGGQSSSASLLELNSLPCLAKLCIDVKTMECFPANFSLPEFVKYEISVGTTAVKCYPSSRSLSLREVDLLAPDRVNTLFQSSYDLTLFCVEGIFNRVLPDLDQGGLNHLKSLKVTSCVYIYSLIMYTPSPSTQIIFANLEKLHLHRLEKMMLLGRAVLPVGSLQKLKYLDILTCKFLMSVALTANWVDRLHNLEEVGISNCEMLRWVFEIQENTAEQGKVPLLSNLRKLSLSSLPQLQSILKGPNQMVSFCNLATVKIYDCNRLGHIFSSNVSQRLLHLEILDIGRCRDLKAIFEEMQEGVSQSRIHSVKIPNLKVVKVDGCNQLRSLFTVSIARGLSNLKELTISRNRELVELVSHEENDNDEDIALPQLTRMQLTNLGSLKRFCPIDNSMDLPLLKELILEECPEWNNFASDHSDYGLKSAPELARLKIDGQLLDGLK